MKSTFSEEFILFLDSLTFEAAEIASPPVARISPNPPVFTESDTCLAKLDFPLYQTTSTTLTIQGFRKKMLSILRNANHVATEAIVDAILGCVVGACVAGAERMKFLEELLSHFHSADVSHFLILPHTSEAGIVRFEGYRFGEADLDALRSRCKHAKSDFAELYGERIEGLLCLMSPVFQHVAIDFYGLMIVRELNTSDLWQDLLQIYFILLARQHFEHMWAHLDRTQVLSLPFNACVLDVHDLRNNIGQYGWKVSIYLNFSTSGAGYVLNEKQTYISHQAGPESLGFLRYKSHRAAYRLNEVGDSELGRTLHSCAGFCQQATRFLEASRIDDAALYATICLEHLFSEKTSTTEAVCTRTAALTFLRLASSYSDAEHELRALYAARSAFVHSGTSVTSPQAERLIAYARETLRSMLVLHFKPENRTTGFREKWVRDLDFIVSGFEAGRTFEASFLAETGIFKS